jgi:propanediol utilization protein
MRLPVMTPSTIRSPSGKIMASRHMHTTNKHTHAQMLLLNDFMQAHAQCAP